MARTYIRDRLGRFAPKGFQGQTSGRGARLMAPGKSRKGGGSKITSGSIKGTVNKPRGLKPQQGIKVPEKRRMTQKEKWARRAEMYEKAAARNTAEAARLYGEGTRHVDYAFATQPGHIPARARMLAKQDKSFELARKAARQASKAKELRRMSTTNKGDAAKRRAQRNETAGRILERAGIKKGSIVGTADYGAKKFEVLRVNQKSVTLKGAFGPFKVAKETLRLG